MYICAYILVNSKTNPQVNKLIANKIKNQREKNGYSQLGLAIDLKIPRTTLSSIESGANQPTIFMLFKICEKLNCEVYDLLPLKSELRIALEKEETNLVNQIKNGIENKGINLTSEQILAKINNI